MSQRPVAVTCGDPAGIGPEIAVKAFQEVGNTIPMVWFGDPRHLPEGTIWHDVTHAGKTSSGLPVHPISFAASSTSGKPTLENAAGVVRAIDAAVASVQAGTHCAVCTAPIHKQVLQDGADFQYPGHTEYLAHLGGVTRPVMMLACPELRTVPLTIHIPIRDVPDAITGDLISETVAIIHADMVKYFGLSTPRICVAGLNPHASEGGKIGREDIDLIGPVIAQLRQQGFTISGPVSADTMFHPKARETYDVALCMYHDQALIPLKTLDFSGGVNVTLGLPFVRTSPDHGTAFEIAGQNKADPTSMIQALKMAFDMGHKV